MVTVLLLVERGAALCEEQHSNPAEDVECCLQRMQCVRCSPVASRYYGLFQPHMMFLGASSFQKHLATAKPALCPLRLSQ